MSSYFHFNEKYSKFGLSNNYEYWKTTEKTLIKSKIHKILIIKYRPLSLIRSTAFNFFNLSIRLFSNYSLY